MLRAWLRWLVTTLCGVGLLLGAVVALGAWRIASFEQREGDADLRRKAGELSYMAEATDAGAPRPNLVVILFDDLGHGDIGSFGSRALETPHLDALAAQGVALEQYYAPAPTCSPSRAGLLTGRWPVRTTLTHVVFPESSALDRLQRLRGGPVRLPADEITLAEALRASGYATAAIGKWHLGDHAPSRPRDLGFDAYFGLLYSNDMSPLALWRDETRIEPDPVDQTTLTPRYTQEAVRFIEANREQPFFLYLAHSFPHIPLHATPEQAGRSAAGPYGDVVADLDRSTGSVIEALDRNGVAERTLLIVTSDNGPWFQGSPGAIRGRKGETFEGGMRVPFLARWPGRIPAGVRSETLAAGVDLFPTALALAGVPLPRDRVIDGVDLMPALRGEARFRRRPIRFHSGPALQALRIGAFKWQARKGIAYGPSSMRLPLAPFFKRGPWLFELEGDPDESYDVHERYPEVATRFQALADAIAAEHAVNPRGWR